MTRKQPKRPTPRAWRAFPVRDGRTIFAELADGGTPHCPWCARLLEASPSTRLVTALVLDARGYDLDCRDCRRFWTVILHTPRSLRLIRMRRLAAAVRAVTPSPGMVQEAVPRASPA